MVDNNDQGHCDGERHRSRFTLRRILFLMRGYINCYHMVVIEIQRFRFSVVPERR